MPVRAVQEKPNHKPPPTGNVLDRIVTVKKTQRPIKLALYGMGKVGKTRFAATFPKPILSIMGNDGTASIEGVPDIDTVFMTSSADVDSLTAAVANNQIVSRQSKKPYQSVVLDTGGELQDILLKEYLKLDEVPLQRTWGMMPSKDSRQDWGIIGMQTKERLWRLLDLSKTNGIHVVIIAHERAFGDEGGSEIKSPVVGPALTGTVARWLEKEVDHVVQCFIREEVVTEVPEEGGLPIERGTGKPEFCLRLVQHHLYRAGLRLPPGVVAPPVLVNGDYEQFARIVRGEKPK